MSYLEDSEALVCTLDVIIDTSSNRLVREMVRASFRTEVRHGEVQRSLDDLVADIVKETYEEIGRCLHRWPTTFEQETAYAVAYRTGWSLRIQYGGPETLAKAMIRLALDKSDDSDDPRQTISQALRAVRTKIRTAFRDKFPTFEERQTAADVADRVARSIAQQFLGGGYEAA